MGGRAHLYREISKIDNPGIWAICAGWIDCVQCKAGSSPKFSNLIYFQFMPHQDQSNSISSINIDFINFQLIFGIELVRGKVILHLHGMAQY